jgi:hypothetical protein
MAELALKTKDLGFRLEQVQDFTPTPMTVATEIYATGVHPYDGADVCVARTPEEKQEQRSFFFWYKPEMKTALRKSMARLGLGDIAARLLDGKQKTVDVTPPPHITPCEMQAPGARLAAATARPHRPKKPSHLDDLLRESGVNVARPGKDQPPGK